MPEWATRSLFHYSHEDKHTRSGQERFTEMLGHTVIDEHTRWPLSMSWVAMMIKKLSLKASNNIKTNKQKANSVFKLPCEDVSVWGIVLIPIPRNSFPRSLFANGGSSNCLLQRAHTQKNESLHLNDWCQYSRSTVFQNLWQKSQHAVALSVSVVCLNEAVNQREKQLQQHVTNNLKASDSAKVTLSLIKQVTSQVLCFFP